MFLSDLFSVCRRHNYLFIYFGSTNFGDGLIVLSDLMLMQPHIETLNKYFHRGLNPLQFVGASNTNSCNVQYVYLIHAN